MNGTGAQTLKIPARVEIIHAPHFIYVHIYNATLRVTAALRAKSKATPAIGGKVIAVIKNCFLNVVESHRHIALLAGICGKGRGNTCLSLFAK